MRNSAGAVVIGGGVIGTSVCYNLASRGVEGPVLVEREGLGGWVDREVVRDQHGVQPAAVHTSRRFRGGHSQACQGGTGGVAQL